MPFDEGRPLYHIAQPHSLAPRPSSTDDEPQSINKRLTQSTFQDARNDAHENKPILAWGVAQHEHSTPPPARLALQSRTRSLLNLEIFTFKSAALLEWTWFYEKICPLWKNWVPLNSRLLWERPWKTFWGCGFTTCKVASEQTSMTSLSRWYYT